MRTIRDRTKRSSQNGTREKRRRDGDRGLSSPLPLTNRNGSTNAIPFGGRSSDDSVRGRPGRRVGELTGRLKTRNGDDWPSGPVSWRLERRVPQEPGSGDGKTIANSGQTGRVCEASGYLALNNGERQFVPECLAPQHEFELGLTTPRVGWNVFSRFVRITDDHLFMEQGTVAAIAPEVGGEALDPANGPMFTAGGGGA